MFESWIWSQAQESQLWVLSLEPLRSWMPKLSNVRHKGIWLRNLWTAVRWAVGEYSREALLCCASLHPVHSFCVALRQKAGDWMRFHSELLYLVLCCGYSMYWEWPLPSKDVAFQHCNNWKYLLCTGSDHSSSTTELIYHRFYDSMNNRTKLCYSTQRSFKDPLLCVVSFYSLSFWVLGLRRSPGVAVSCKQAWPIN